MKIYKLYVSVAILSIGLFSCKKSVDEIVAFKGENLIQPTIMAKVVVDTVSIIQQGANEDGFKLFFSKDGQVTQLGCKFPQTGNYRVSFWDFESKSLITCATVAITEINTFQYVNISPIDVVAEKRYVLSINNSCNGASVPSYLAKKKIFNGNIFPFTIGNATFERPYYKFSATTVFPDTPSNQSFLYNLPDLTFVPNNTP